MASSLSLVTRRAKSRFSMSTQRARSEHLLATESELLCFVLTVTNLPFLCHGVCTLNATCFSSPPKSSALLSFHPNPFPSSSLCSSLRDVRVTGFTTDNTKVFSAGEEGVVKLWDVPQEQELLSTQIAKVNACLEATSLLKSHPSTLSLSFFYFVPFSPSSLVACTFLCWLSWSVSRVAWRNDEF